MSSSTPNHARIPILYVILGVLLVISIVPMYFYSAQVEAINRDRLKTNEMLLQNTVTRSLADDLSQHEHSLRVMLANLSSAIQVASGGDFGEKNIESPELRALLENFVSSSDEIAYATLLNADGKGIRAGRISPDAFLQRELERAYSAARDGRVYNGQALVVGEGKNARTVFLVSSPVQYGPRFLGMIASVVDLQFLDQRPARRRQRWTHALRRRFARPPRCRGHARIRHRPADEESRNRSHLRRNRQQGAGG